MNSELNSHLASIIVSAEAALDVVWAEPSKPVFLKALPDQDRFKLSSVWIQLEDGKFQHLQSSRITTAERLAGYTRVIKRG